ncbi:MAG: hypothetical protein PVH77_03715 [Phycisphaerales bacterium]
MQQLTLLIAVGACTLIFFLPPIWWLVVYVATLAWYPSYLTIQVGTLDFSVARIVILVIYICLFVHGKLLRYFRFNYLDAWVVIYFVSQILAGAMTSSFSALLEHHAGAAFDMLLPYFAIRAIITDKERYLFFLKTSVYIVAPMAIFGFYESWTGHNPFGFLREYRAWGISTDLAPRRGFSRAFFTTSHPIMFGLFFAILAPIWAGLIYQVRKNKLLCYAGITLAAIGVFSSMSSGPLAAALSSAAFIAFYRFKKYWKLLVAVIILICVAIELGSDRHFYYYPTRYAFGLSSAWYRGRLVDIAFFEGGMSGHWLIGYGHATEEAAMASADWGGRIDGRYRVDMVNEYLLILFRYGFIALIPFLAMIYATIKKLIEAWRMSLLDADKWMIWCLAASFAGLLIGFCTTSLHAGQPTILFFILLGLCGVMPLIISDNNNIMSKRRLTFQYETPDYQIST